MSDQPGMMLFFDEWMELLEDYSMEEIGELLRASLMYGAHGEVTEFEDRAMRTAFRRMMQSIDNDSKRYDRKKAQRIYAAYSKTERNKGNDPIDFETWLSTVYDR